MDLDYLESLALPPQVHSTESDTRAVALERAHGLRKLEIENYWKRANYFWLFQAASITLFGVLMGGQHVRTEALLAPAALGAITAQVGFLTAKGSKFWQQNWESHVDNLEGHVEGRLTQVIFHQGRWESSVSRINESMFFLFILGWIGVFSSVCLDVWFDAWLQCHPAVEEGFAAICLMFGMLFVLWGTRQNIDPTVSKDARDKHRFAIKLLLWCWDKFRTGLTHDRETRVVIRPIGRHGR